VALPSLASRILRVVGVLLLAAAVSAVAVRAGFWQYGRHETRAEAIELYEANAEAEPVTLATALPPGEAVDDDEWTTVTVTGTYDAASLTLLRNRPVDRERVYQQLAWFDTDDGRSLLLSIGYIPVPPEDEEPATADLPAGEATVTAVLRRSEDDDGRRDAGATRVTPAQMPEPAYDPVDGYAMVRESCAADGCVDAYGEPVPLPTLSLGPHLAYAWQWFAFAAIVPVAGIMLARRDWSGVTAAPATPKRPRRPRPAHREPTDEEIEDAL